MRNQVPFSTLGGFATYAGFVDIDWLLLAVIGLAAVVGGYIGSHVMHLRLSSAQVKKLIAVLLLMLAAKMIFDLLAG